MDIRNITPVYSVSSQLMPGDLNQVVEQGFKSILINRPDGEGTNQPDHQEMETAARAAGLSVQYLPVISGQVEDADVDIFRTAISILPSPILAYCASGTRSATLWALFQAGRMKTNKIFETVEQAGYELAGIRSHARFAAQNDNQPSEGQVRHQIVIVGGGAAGIATAASLKARKNDLDIAIIEPNPSHYYQPGFTLVGGGVFRSHKVIAQTERLIPKEVKWIRSSVSAFDPESNSVTLEDGETIAYDALVVAAGLKIDLDAVTGLKDALGQYGVTTNYLLDYAPYTNRLAESLTSGRAIFTQPRGPFKCAGAPQKAMYLTCDTWRRRGILKNMDVSFHTPGEALFGIKAFIPALQAAVAKYGIKPRFQEELVAVDGPRQIATFETPSIGEGVEQIERSFDMLHVVPPNALWSLSQTVHSPMRMDG